MPVCPLCGCQDNEFCFSERGYDLLACNRCELFFVDPYPQDVHDRVSEYDYDEIEILDAEKHYLAEIEFQKRYFSIIDQELADAKAVLDVGCGTGRLLERLSVYPVIKRVGIELNRDRAALARKIAGCEIHQVSIEEFSTGTNFDVIILINVLSHIPSFDKLFNKLRSILQRNGKVILKVGEARGHIRKGDVFDWGIPDHLHFLGLNTISFICEKYGFRILKHQRIPLSRDMFSAYRFRSPGRSRIRNGGKKLVLYTPFALPMLARIYDLLKGKRIYSSFIVLTPRR